MVSPLDYAITVDDKQISPQGRSPDGDVPLLLRLTLVGEQEKQGVTEDSKRLLEGNPVFAYIFFILGFIMLKFHFGATLSVYTKSTPNEKQAAITAAAS